MVLKLKGRGGLGRKTARERVVGPSVLREQASAAYYESFTGEMRATRCCSCCCCCCSLPLLILLTLTLPHTGQYLRPHPFPTSPAQPHMCRVKLVQGTRTWLCWQSGHHICAPYYSINILSNIKLTSIHFKLHLYKTNKRQNKYKL